MGCFVPAPGVKKKLRVVGGEALRVSMMQMAGVLPGTWCWEGDCWLSHCRAAWFLWRRARSTIPAGGTRSVCEESELPAPWADPCEDLCRNAT